MRVHFNNMSLLLLYALTSTILYILLITCLLFRVLFLFKAMFNFWVPYNVAKVLSSLPMKYGVIVVLQSIEVSISIAWMLWTITDSLRQNSKVSHFSIFYCHFPCKHVVSNSFSMRIIENIIYNLLLIRVLSVRLFRLSAP